MISSEEYNRDLLGYSIVDCVVRAREMCGFILKNDAQSNAWKPEYHCNVVKRLVVVYFDEPFGDQVSCAEFFGYDDMLVGATSIPVSQYVCISRGGGVYVLGNGEDKTQWRIRPFPLGPLRGEVRRLRRIDGWLFIVGNAYTVAKRLDKNKWQDLSLNLPQPSVEDAQEPERSSDMDFSDVDGFSADELYAVGGKGGVWRLKERSWSLMTLPTDNAVESVCCAGDGLVYVGAEFGALYRGRDERWELIHPPELALPFQDIVWHAGRLWCTSDDGLWTLQDGHLLRADVPPEVRGCAGHLSVGDGVMLMAGAGGAALHDGQEWQMIFSSLCPETAPRD